MKYSALLPMAVVSVKCPNCGADLRIDPASEQATCAYCKATSYVQTKKKQKGASRPPPPPNTQIIYVPSPGMAVIPVVVSLFGVLVVAGIVITVALAQKTATSFTTDLQSTVTKAVAQAAGQAVTAAPSASYFADASGVAGRFRERLGAPARALEMVIYPEYVIVEAQDPAKKQNVDRYTLRGGSVGEGDPIRLMGRQKTSLEASLFSLDALDFALVPKLASDAVQRSRIDGGEVTHVIYSSRAPFGKGFSWRVYVRSPRDSKYVEYDEKGKLRAVH